MTGQEILTLLHHENKNLMLQKNETEKIAEILAPVVRKNNTAVILLKNKKYAHSCFHSHQSAEKAVKAVWYFLEAEPWGHSIGKMIGVLCVIIF